MLKKYFAMFFAAACLLICTENLPAAPATAEADSTVAVRRFVFTGGITVSSINAIGGAIFQNSQVNYIDQLRARLCLKLEPDAKAILGQTLDGNPNILLLTAFQQDNRVVLAPNSELLEVTVNLENSSAKPAAEQFMAKVVAALPSVVTSLDEEFRTGLQPWLNDLTTQRDQIEAKLKSAQATEQNIQADLVSSGVIDSNPADIHQLAQKLDEQREMATIDRTTTFARRDALAKAVADLTAQATKKSGDDDIVAELDKIVAAKEDRLEWMKSNLKAGNVSQADVATAQAEVAEAHVRVIERKEAVARAAGGDALVQLQTELQNIQVSAAEAQAREEAMQEMARTLINAQELGKKLAEVQHDEGNLDNSLAGIKSQIEQEQGQIGAISHDVKPLDPNPAK